MRHAVALLAMSLLTCAPKDRVLYVDPYWHDADLAEIQAGMRAWEPEVHFSQGESADTVILASTTLGEGGPVTDCPGQSRAPGASWGRTSGDKATICIWTGVPTAYLREVTAHELGHTLFLVHTQNPDALMYPYVHGATGPTCGDWYALSEVWGTRLPKGC